MLLNFYTIFRDFLNLIFPNCCIGCNNVFDDRSKFICDQCYNLIPKTNFHLYPTTNNLFTYLHKDIGIDSAFAMFYFQKNSVLQKLIHTMKYYKMSKIATWFGEEYGKILSQSNKIETFDVIIPIPLHKKKLKKRGYNQSELFANGLSIYLKCPVDVISVKRIKETETQTNKDASERKINMENAFSCISPQNLQGKRILLVDDLITTGSTIKSCVNEIKSKCKCKITVCAIAKDIRELV